MYSQYSIMLHALFVHSIRTQTLPHPPLSALNSFTSVYLILAAEVWNVVTVALPTALSHITVICRCCSTCWLVGALWVMSLAITLIYLTLSQRHQSVAALTIDAALFEK